MSLAYAPLVQLKPVSAGALARDARAFSIPDSGVRAFQEIRALLKPRDILGSHADPRELELFGAALLLGVPHPVNQEYASHLAARAGELLSEQLGSCRGDTQATPWRRSVRPIDERVVALRNALAGYLYACETMRAKQDADRAKRQAAVA